MPDVAIVVPVLGRPHRAEPLVASVVDSTDVEWELWFMCTRGDLEQIDAAKALIDVDARVKVAVLDEWLPGDYARKINLGYRLSSAPWIFHAADDLRFHPEWASRAIAVDAGVVGTNDLGNPLVTSGRHATHSLVARWYADEHGTIDQPGLILHEGYHHCWVDNELIGTAKARGMLAFCRDSIVEHLHPIWHKGEIDATYARGQERYKQDQMLFAKRRLLWTTGSRRRRP